MGNFVSGHGGRYQIPTHRVFVPNGFRVALFTVDNVRLTNAEAWPLYNHLLAGDTAWADQRVVSWTNPGEEIYNYSCWNYPELGFASGVFRVGAITSRYPVIDLSGYTGDHPLTLGAMFGMLPPGDLYWVACTIVS